MKRFGDPLLIQTKRLQLRAWTLEDAADLYDYASNPNVGPHGGWKPHETMLESIHTITDLFVPIYHSWAIVHNETGRIIGSVGFEDDPRRTGTNCLELGYALAEECWGNGYMTEAASAVIAHGFEHLKLDMISIYRNPKNVRSGRVIEKLGFIYEGTLRKANLIYNGELRDIACYSMLLEEFQKK